MSAANRINPDKPKQDVVSAANRIDDAGISSSNIGRRTQTRTMTQYRRPHALGATWFFTVNLARRQGNSLLVDQIDTLRESLRRVKQQHPYRIDAMVVMPEHLHAIWTLPADDADIGLRWGLIKSGFSRGVAQTEYRRQSHLIRGERGIWQRRFWEHQIRDEADLAAHIDYIHYNPVKHGWAKRVADWPHSTFHRYVAQGWYGVDWGSTPPQVPRGVRE